MPRLYDLRIYDVLTVLAEVFGGAGLDVMVRRTGKGGTHFDVANLRDLHGRRGDPEIAFASFVRAADCLDARGVLDPTVDTLVWLGTLDIPHREFAVRRHYYDDRSPKPPPPRR